MLQEALDRVDIQSSLGSLRDRAQWRVAPSAIWQHDEFNGDLASDEGEGWVQLSTTIRIAMLAIAGLPGDAFVDQSEYDGAGIIRKQMQTHALFE